MGSALEDIAFLARSESRLRILESLASGDRTTQELREELEIPRTTLSRNLAKLEKRRWITEQAGVYEITPRAVAIVAKFDPLIETVEGIHSLGEAIEWLPPPARDLDYRHFRGCTVTTPTAASPTAPTDRGVELFRTADYHRTLVSTVSPRFVKEVKEHQIPGEGIVPASFIETLRADPDRAEPWSEFAATGSVWIYRGDIPIDCHIMDDRVLIWLVERKEDKLDVYGLLETENDVVRSWAEDLFESYRRDADRLDPATLER